jgi:hypothetical protein
VLDATQLPGPGSAVLALDCWLLRTVVEAANVVMWPLQLEGELGLGG